MSTQRIKKVMILLGLPIIILLCLFNYKQDIRRYHYEKYLNKEYSRLNLQPVNQKESEVGQDKPELAGIQDYYMTIDPTEKRVPHERLVSAIKESKLLLSRKSLYNDLYERFIWNEVPSNMGGRVRSLMYDPNDSLKNYKKVWAGSVTGGLWRNIDVYDSDSKWRPVSDVWENLSISCLTYDPNNTQIFYAGTGEPQTAVTIYRESSTRGVGIWKSTDGGDSWNLIPSTSQFPYISDIVVRNEAGQSVIYAGVVSGTYKGENHMAQPNDGLYRSDDGGSTWTQVLPNIIGQSVPYSPSDIEIAASSRIFVGTYRNVQGFGGATILCSDNGIDWTIFKDYKDLIESSTDPTVVIPGRTILASAPSAPNTIYAVIAAGGFTAENFTYYRGRYMIKSSNNGDTWTQVNLPFNEAAWATLAWHALILKVDPNNENTVYAGGLDLHKSSDGGINWEEISSWFNYGIYSDLNNYPYVHADQHMITFKPHSSDTICFTNDGGVFITFNATNNKINFEERNRSLNTLQFYTCDLNPSQGVTDFIGGLQDNGTVFYKNTPIDNELSYVSGGDGAYCFIDNDTPGYYITTVYYNGIYVNRKTATGLSLVNSIFDFRSGTFINPMDYDATNNTLYANAVTFTNQLSNQLLRIKNITSQSYNAQFISLGTNSNVPFSSVLVSKLSTSINTILYVGTQTGKLYRINYAQTTPLAISIGSNLFPTANISCIVEGETSNELLVTFSNYGVSSVWFTDNSGTSWKQIEGNLPDMPVRWALFDPDNKNSVLLATEVGVWATENIYDESVNWTPIVNGLANVRVDMLRLRKSDNTILAATHGRGLFYCNLGGGTSIDDISISENNLFHVYPNPINEIMKVKFDEDIKEPFVIKIYSEDGKVAKTIKVNTILKDEAIDINLTGNNPGFYFISLNFRNKTYSKKIVLSN